MRDQAVAILWAQWRSFRNRFPKSDVASVLTVVVATGWYALWAVAAFAVGVICREAEPGTLGQFLPGALLLSMLYWQVIPLLMASTGHSLEVPKLKVYPIPHPELFTLEVILRVTSAFEMLLMVLGATAGLFANRHVPLYAPFGLLLFVVFNLSLAAGLRDLLGRLLAQKRIREIVVLVFVMLAALPQVLLQRGEPGKFGKIFQWHPGPAWPWVGFAQFASGEQFLLPLVSVLAWTGAAVWFGRWQFERNLVFDAAAAQSSVDARPEGAGFVERIYRIPSTLFPGQLGTMVEKEIRSLVRSPRFRLVFLMSFTFGLMIWMPLAMRHGKQGILQTHFLTAVMVYGVMLLSEVTVWNVFGFDRSAVQVYYTAPVKFSTVIVAKNISTAAFIFLEAIILTFVCSLLPVHLSPGSILEALGVTAVVAIYIVSMGNMISMRNPRAVDPAQSWRRSSAGRAQAFLILVYMLVSIPIAFAFLAQYAFESDLAFYLVLLFDFAVGCVVYWVALDSAVESGLSRKELIIATLSAGQGPVA